MPIVAAGLVICEKCNARQVCAILMRPTGPSAEPPAGWHVVPRTVVARGEAQVECLCPACKPDARTISQDDIDAATLPTRVIG